MRRTAAAISLTLALGAGGLAWHRHQLPYNDQGRYFDPTQAVVYDVAAVEVLTAAVLFTLLGLFFLFRCAKTKEPQESPSAPPAPPSP